MSETKRPAEATEESRPAEIYARPRRRWRRLALLVCSAVLSLLAVFSAEPAQALVVPPPAPTVIGETLAGADVGVEGGVAAGTCIASVACGLIVAGAIGVGLLAYSTRDTWMPWVEGLFGGGGQHSFQLVTKPCVMNPAFQLAGSGFTVSVPFAGCDRIDPSIFLAFGVDVAYQCSGLSEVTGYNINYQQWPNASSGAYPWPTGTAGPETVNLCPSGSTLLFVSGTICIASYTGTCGGDNALTKYSFYVGAPVPTSSLSVVTTTHCLAPDGHTFDISMTFQGIDGHMPMPSCRQALPGSIPLTISTSTGYPGAEQPFSTYNLFDLHNTYPLCFDSNGAFLDTCVVRVWINNMPCHVGYGDCPDWQTAAQDHGDTVTCQWGPYVIPIEQCNPLKRAYITGEGVQVIACALPDGTPVDCSNAPAPEPSPTSTVGPGPAPLPTTGVNPSTEATPGPVATAPPLPAPDPATAGSASCWGQGWSWNPVSWVYVPIKCALSWAFVPTGTLPAITSPTLAGWTIPLAVFDDSCGAWSSTLPLGAGSWAHDFPVSLPDTCGGIGGTVAGFSRILAPALLGLTVAIRTYRKTVRSLG